MIVPARDAEEERIRRRFNVANYDLMVGTELMAREWSVREV